MASSSLLTKVLADFLSVIYLLTLVLKHATKSYTRPLYTSYQMKRKLTLILLTLTFTSCFFSNYESELIKSPTGNFEIKATVNRTDKNAEDFAYVIIHLYDTENNKLTELNTGAGDGNKWTIGWTEVGDTIVLQSSDIGNKAWILNQDKPNQIKMTDELNERAEFLYSEKYK